MINMRIFFSMREELNKDVFKTCQKFVASPVLPPIGSFIAMDGLSEDFFRVTRIECHWHENDEWVYRVYTVVDNNHGQAENSPDF